MIDNVYSKADVAEFKLWMEWASRFVIVTHISPDGDAIGSSLALYHYLAGKGKSVSVVIPDSMPDFLSWLPAAENAISYKEQPELADKLLQETDVVCCLDFNVPTRIGNVAESMLQSKAKKILIDHHLNPGDFCDLLLSRPDASSTAELVFQFICALGDYSEVNNQVATCIYTGMMTDTGGFTYNSNHSRIYHIISFLLKNNIDKDAIYRNVYNNYSESRLRLMGYVLHKKMKVFPEMSTALITLSDKELKENHYKKGDSEGFVNLPLQIKGIKFSVFLREDADENIIKASLRSVGDVPCNIFASTYFNGGGHKNASGGEIHNSLKAAEAIFFKGMEEWSKSDDECIKELFKKS
ncbi:MAG: bifunctional oligoribonuclease/PAP phosphatase NrnA [Bacteroidaceae bacterium]|nr:bifunctional oligoribonuclease/PAP phosphatase NrnA [Bacteroidaceae bacterium]